MVEGKELEKVKTIIDNQSPDLIVFCHKYCSRSVPFGKVIVAEQFPVVKLILKFQISERNPMQSTRIFETIELHLSKPIGSIHDRT